MQIEVGSIVEGKITGITNFGAFVQLPGGKTGLVHISEVAGEYVKDIREHLKDVKTVKVKVLSADDNGKISLSIKQAKEPTKPASQVKPAEFSWSSQRQSPSMSFEDKLNKFKNDSDERMLDLKRSVDSKRGSSYKKSANSYN